MKFLHFLCHWHELTVLDYISFPRSTSHVNWRQHLCPVPLTRSTKPAHSWLKPAGRFPAGHDDGGDVCVVCNVTGLGRWVASDGDNMVCRCCETSCGEQRRRRRSAADAGTVYRSNTTTSPGERTLNTEHHLDLAAFVLLITCYTIICIYSVDQFWVNCPHNCLVKWIPEGLFLFFS